MLGIKARSTWNVWIGALPSLIALGLLSNMT